MPGTLGAVSPLSLRQQEPLESGSRLLLVTQESMNYLSQLGLPIPNAPQPGSGELPLDITRLDDDELGRLLTVMTQWCGFVDFQFAVAQTESTTAEVNLAFVKSHVRVALKSDESGRKLTVQDKNDLVNIDADVVKAQSRYLYWYTIYEYLKGMRETYQRRWDLVSRRITQRGQEVERMKREHGVAGVPVPFPRTFSR